MNTLFDNLGDDISQRWQASGHAVAAFPAIARTALLAHDLPSKITHTGLVHEALRANRWPAQFGSPFGQPPMNLYVGHGFYIEVLTWLDSTTAIHQHNFSGAFQVLHGSSLHSRYTFECNERIDNRLLIGNTRFHEAEQLQQGAVCEIASGDALIHSLFHLDHPSASIVVRTLDDSSGTQYMYAKPHVAFDPFWEPEPQATQFRLLTMLARVDDTSLPDALTDSILRSDAWSAWRFLEFANRHAVNALDDLLNAARKRHGTWVEQLRPSLSEARRQANIVLRRDRIRETEHRFFLALLLNLPDRESIFAAIRVRYPDCNPHDWVVSQLRALSGEDCIGLTFNDVSLQVMTGLLQGHPEHAIQNGFEQQFGCREVRAQQLALSKLFTELREAQLLQPLFA